MTGQTSLSHTHTHKPLLLLLLLLSSMAGRAPLSFSLCVYYSSTHFISCVKYAENRRWRRPPDYSTVGLFITCHLGSSFELCLQKRDCAGQIKKKLFLNLSAYDQVAGENMRNNPSMTLAYHLSSRAAARSNELVWDWSTAGMNYWAGTG